MFFPAPQKRALWIALLLGQVSSNLTVSPLLWHAHEMLFGFAVAVIVGFLLTAGKSWTGLATPRGAVLAALAGLWLAARLAAVFAPYAVYAALDLLLLPLVAVILITVLLHAGNRRNLPLGRILLLPTAANAAFHAAVLGVNDIAPVCALHAGLAKLQTHRHPRERHALVFGRFDALQTGETMQLVNDHDPQPQRFQFDDRAFGQFEWTALESGPTVWRVQITRIGIKPIPAATDSCCSGGSCCG